MNSSSSCYCCCCCNESSNKNHESFEHHIEKKIEILEDKKRKGLLSSIPHVSEGDEGIIIGTCLKEVFPYDSHKRLLIKFHKQNIILALLYQTEISSIWPPSSSPPSTNQKEDNVSVQLENEFNTVILGTDMDTCISKNNIMNRHLANEQEQNNEIDSDNNFKIKRIDNNDRPKLSKKYSRIQSQYNQKTLMKQSSINGDNKTSNVLSTDASTSSSTSPSSSSSISRSPRKKSPPPSRQLKSRISSRETSSTSTFYSQRASSLPRPSTSSSTLSSTSTTDNESSSVDNKMIRESSSMPRSNQSKSLLKNDETFKEVEEEKDDEEEEEEEEEEERGDDDEKEENKTITLPDDETTVSRGPLWFVPNKLAPWRRGDNISGRDLRSKTRYVPKEEQDDDDAKGDQNKTTMEGDVKETKSNTSEEYKDTGSNV